MKKKINLFLILLLPVLNCFAQTTANMQTQENLGVNFIKNLNWEAIKTKASIENKFIFVDCFATWCGPCKAMDKNVFSKERTAGFMNKEFISVKVQMDVTADDDELTKNWRKDAVNIQNSFKVTAYPTYLIFSPKGQIIYRFSGATASIDEFINIVTRAINSNFYHKTMEEFEKWKTDPLKVNQMAYMAKEYGDTIGKDKLSNWYIKSMDSVFTSENIKFLREFTDDSKDFGFKLFLEHPEKVAKFFYPTAMKKLVTDIILNENVDFLNAMNQNGFKPDWNRIYKDISAKKYPENISLRAVARGKMKYYKKQNDSLSYIKAYLAYAEQFLKKENDELGINSCAYDVYLYSRVSDKTEINRAISLFEPFVKEQEIYPRAGDKGIIAALFDTYAHLLFKAEKITEAITWQEKAAKLDPNSSEIKKNLDIMIRHLNK
ncbi:DUF255 domain-containing protein [Pedobacter heparinus]|uniref:DUF255 domain-containing protein n=1 Tax=Pedobacter heparinus TaxID=984 RepID=UPI00292E21EC|nr:DUF255 domain-containing protein [Pedobacter heparinus]